MAGLFVMGLASALQAQPFEQAIARAVQPSDCPRMNTVGPLAARICNQGGSAGASSGSTSTLTREVSPLEERKEQRLIGPFNVFISGEYEHLDKDETTFESGFKSNSGRAVVGADYSLTDRLLLGAALQYGYDRGKFDSESPVSTEDFGTLSIPRGRFDTHSYGALVYANFLPTPALFINTSFAYTRKNYFLRRGVAVVVPDLGGDGRSVTGIAEGLPDGNEFKLGVNGGYNVNFQNITIGPRVGVNYRHTQIDRFRERGRVTSGDPSFNRTGLELIYNSQYENSLTSVLGAFGSVAISTGLGVVVPQVVAEYVHEFLDPQRNITFSFVDDLNRRPFRFENDPPDRNYFNLGAGVVLVLPRGFSPFLNYRALVGYKDQRSHIVTAGLRIEF